mmetsp:Transcript_25662/g.46466  ORF Transcript_25662/g.46466 Transcript_25662/m.46466 type:complete len:289 (-) Transcript_25662:400-1266(-)
MVTAFFASESADSSWEIGGSGVFAESVLPLRESFFAESLFSPRVMFSAESTLPLRVSFFAESQLPLRGKGVGEISSSAGPGDSDEDFDLDARFERLERLERIERTESSSPMENEAGNGIFIGSQTSPGAFSGVWYSLEMHMACFTDLSISASVGSLSASLSSVASSSVTVRSLTSWLLELVRKANPGPRLSATAASSAGASGSTSSSPPSMLLAELSSASPEGFLSFFFLFFLRRSTVSVDLDLNSICLKRPEMPEDTLLSSSSPSSSSLALVLATLGSRPCWLIVHS